MNIIILLFICIVFLDFGSAMDSRSVLTTESTSGAIPPRPPIQRVYTRRVSTPGASLPRESTSIANTPIESTPVASTPRASGKSADSNVYLHLTDDRVFSGHFQSIAIPGYPRWVLDPNPKYYADERVFILMPGGKGGVSVIAPFHYVLDANDVKYGGHRCLLARKRGIFLSGNLHPYDHEKLPQSSHPLCFVRMPDNNAVYMTELDYSGHRPKWID